jgi:hypothetical protein
VRRPLIQAPETEGHMDNLDDIVADGSVLDMLGGGRR